jgi:hypothetical protein
MPGKGVQPLESRLTERIQYWLEIRHQIGTGRRVRLIDLPVGKFFRYWTTGWPGIVLDQTGEGTRVLVDASGDPEEREIQPNAIVMA